MNKVKAKNRIKLDHTGQYWATIHSEDNPRTFSLTIHLNEVVNPEILQQAVNDLIKRLPHLNVRLKSGCLWWYHDILDTPLKIAQQSKNFVPARHFKKDETLTRILYGERHFTIEILHTICDGRGLLKIINALLIRYYERLGYRVNKQGMIDCATSPRVEETEDAYARYADLRKSKKEKVKREIYIPKYQAVTPTTIIKKFDLNLLKYKAKTHDATVTEYIIAHMMIEFAKQREKEGSQKAVVVDTPVDCRTFFPTDCLRNFNSYKMILMPESSNFADLLQKIKAQFGEINADLCQETMSEMENLMRLANYVPLFIKKLIIRKIGDAEKNNYSVLLSNLGLVKLPEEIKDKVEMFSFPIGNESHVPYQFSCVTVGNTLTLTIVTTAKDNQIVENIYSAIMADKE